MKPSFRVLIRSAAVISIFYALGHTAGYPWTPGTGEAATAVVDAMKNVQFQALGETRSYWDFYIGFGLIISFLQVVIGLVLWATASVGSVAPRPTQSILGAIAFGSAAEVFLGNRYFFLPPTLFSVVILILVLAGMFRLHKEAR